MKILAILLLLGGCAKARVSTLATCKAPDMINRTSQPWNKYDMAVLENAKTRCGAIYGPYHSCLVAFYKLNIRSYGAVCGGKR